MKVIGSSSETCGEIDPPKPEKCRAPRSRDSVELNWFEYCFHTLAVEADPIHLPCGIQPCATRPRRNFIETCRNLFRAAGLVAALSASGKPHDVTNLPVPVPRCVKIVVLKT